MFASVGITEKSLLVWQFAQVAVADVGMWFEGLVVTKQDRKEMEG